MFKVGDKVICIDDDGALGIELNKIFTITYVNVNTEFIGVNDMKSIYHYLRFKKDNRKEKLKRILK